MPVIGSSPPAPALPPGRLSQVEYQLSRFLENKQRVKWQVWILTQGKNSILKTLGFVFYYCYYLGHTLRHVGSEFPAQEWKELRPPSGEAWSLSHWATREVPGVWFKYDIFRDFVLAPDKSMRDCSFILWEAFGRLFFLSTGTL